MSAGSLPLLAYAFETEPDPLQAEETATITLVVSNATNRIVTCASITVSFPTGTNAKDLTADASGISTVPPAGWNVAQSGGGFVLAPDAGRAPIGSDGLEFVFAGVAVNDQPGTCHVEIDESASSGDEPAAGRSESIALQKFPPQFTLSGLSASPTEVDPGGSATLMWTGSAASYVLQYDPDGLGQTTKSVGNVGPYTAPNLTNAAGVDFTLEVSVTLPGEDAPLLLQRQCEVAVTVPLPAITAFGATISGACTGSETALLSWNVSGRDVTCAITGSSQAFEATGTLTVARPPGASSSPYTLTAQNITGTTTSTLTVHWTPAIAATVALQDTPSNLAISADGTRAYVCGQSSVATIDTATWSVIGSPATFPSQPALVNVSPDGTSVFVTSFTNGSVPNAAVTVCNAATMEPDGEPIPLAVEAVAPSAMATQAAVGKGGSWLFIAPGLVFPTVVAVVDVTTREQHAAIPVAPTPGATAVSPDGATLLVTCVSAGAAAFFSVDTLQQIGTTLQVAPADADGTALNAVFAPDGARAYVLCQSGTGPTSSNSVVALDVANTTVALTSAAYGAADQVSNGLAVSADGSLLFCGAAETLYVLDAASLQALSTIDVAPASPRDVHVTPDGNYVLLTSPGTQDVRVVRLPWVTGGQAASTDASGR